MMAYSQHPNPLQHQVQQQGPQQHIQGHPATQAQANAMAMQQMHPGHQPNVQAYQQAQMAALAGAGHPNANIQQQALLVRQRQQQQLMGGANPMVFQGQNHGGPQVRPGMMPNGMYPGGVPGGVPGGNMASFAAGNPQMMPRFPPHVQQQLQQQQQQQAQIAAAQQFTMQQNQAALQGNPHPTTMGMQPHQNPGQMPLQMQQAQQAHHMQRMAVNAAAQQQHQQSQQKALGTSVLRIHQFADHLSSFNPTATDNHIEHWRKFVNDFFSPVGVMRQQLRNTEKNELKQFEITTALLARYYFTLFESGVQTIQMTLEHPREKPMVNGMMVECPRATFIYWFEGGCHLVAQGVLRVTFNQAQTIDMLDFQTQNHTEYISRQSVNEMLSAGSPEMMKASPGGKPNMRRSQQPQRLSPTKPVTNQFGIPAQVLQLLENAETFLQMKDLINFSHANQHMDPQQALIALVQQQQLQQQQQQQHRLPPGVNPNQPGQPQPGGPHPNPQQQQQQQQQQNQNQQQPGSQHNSPMITGMQQPGAASNPGSQSSTTVGSANTSPNQTNKRRRNSGSSTSNSNPNSNPSNGSNGFMKQEDTGDDAKIKQSPRVGGGKRAKLGS